MTSTPVELNILQSMLASLEPLDTDVRDRILRTIDTYFGRPSRAHSPPFSADSSAGDAKIARPFSSVPAFSDNVAPGPKQFLAEKQPQTDVERVACLAYYLAHYLDQPHFKTLDISKLNTEAAQVKFSNAAYAVNNAVKTGYLAAAPGGARQISMGGEMFVAALPDRERARSAMRSAHKRRGKSRGKKNGPS